MDGMNKEKWQAMSRRDKYEHIKYYYGKYIIIGSIVLAVVINLLYATITNVEPTLSILMLNNLYTTDTDISQSHFDDFCAKYGYDNSKGKMDVTKNFYILTEIEDPSGESLNAAQENLTALQTWLYAGVDDVIIGRGDFMTNSWIDGEAFLDLRDVFTEEQLAKYADYIVYGQPVDLDEEFDDVADELKEPYPCAIHLPQNEWILETGCFKECYAAIPLNAGNKKAAADFLNYLLSRQP